MTIFSDPFPTDTAGLRAAHNAEWLELADGDVLDLRIGPVAKQLGEATVRMVYRRPWETVPPVEVVEYRIRVQGR